VYDWVKPRPYTHKMWTEVSSSVSHFLQVGLLLSPIVYKCHLKVLCPVRRPMTILDCVLFKDNNWALVARSGPEIISSLSLCTTRNTPQYQMLVFQPAFYLSSYILPRDPQERLQSNNHWTVPSLASLSAISFPHTPACPGTQYSPTVCWVVPLNINHFWSFSQHFV
jgi:hypothetical protein